MPRAELDWLSCVDNAFGHVHAVFAVEVVLRFCNTARAWSEHAEAACVDAKFQSTQ